MGKITIKQVEVYDIRVPTSDSGLGSDPFHTSPDYSAVYTVVKSSTEYIGLSIVFTCGAGNDWVVYGVKQLAKMIRNYSLEEFIADPGSLHKRLLEHHQLRWLGDGVFRMSVGGIINALWDLWAKIEKKPLWKLLLDLSEEEIVDCIDWRYLCDVLNPEEAIEILKSKKDFIKEREKELNSVGMPAYLTVGWSGIGDDEVISKIIHFSDQGFQAFKIKVGVDIKSDFRRLELIRTQIGEEKTIMVDSNQVWGVDEAINYMERLAHFNLKWIEEPTARDDVVGYETISKKLEKYNIGVAGGEQIQSPVIYKQMLSSGALQFCQIDAARMGGVNDVLPVILLAKKYNIPVCPHGGGIGLCNMVLHFAIWDQIAVSGRSDIQLIEYIDFLQEGVFVEPIKIRNGNYMLPEVYGWGIEFKDSFLSNYIYPNGSVWQQRLKNENRDN